MSKKEKEVLKFDRSKMAEPEELLVLKQHRAKPHQSDVCRMYLPGEKYVQAGMNKAQVILTGYCTTDLTAEVPINTKRKAPKPGEEKHLNAPVDVLSKKIDKLIDTIDELVIKKR